MIIMSNINDDEVDFPMSEFLASTQRAVLWGPNLDKMNRVMIQSITASLDSLEVSTNKPS